MPSDALSRIKEKARAAGSACGDDPDAIVEATLAALIEHYETRRDRADNLATALNTGYVAEMLRALQESR